jgi:hypothetical protein
VRIKSFCVAVAHTHPDLESYVERHDRGLRLLLLLMFMVLLWLLMLLLNRRVFYMYV